MRLHDDQMTPEQLTVLAHRVIEGVQRRLPPGVRDAALRVPVSFELHPKADLVADGLDPDVLGLFVGADHGRDGDDSPPFPPQILLFLENILDQAEDDESTYCEEVRLTYLHELGHYLGWGEEEITLRGLE